jgi:hypothetical protein
MHYTLYKDDPIDGKKNAVQRTDDNGQVWSIPFDPANTDYQEYLKWLAEGNLPIPAESTEGSSNPAPEPADGDSNGI